MVMTERSYSFKHLLKLARLWIIGTLFITSISSRWVTAQSLDDSWTDPQNLSHSGATTNPSIVIDSNGVLHVVWQDEFANYVYSEFTDGEWSAPERTSLHLLFGRPGLQESSRQPQQTIYTGPNPLFIAGPGQYIYAVWISPQGSLFTSRVPNQDFKKVGSWSRLRLISSAVVSFAATVDPQDELHVAYMRTVDATSNPAGIYYVHIKTIGTNLVGSTLLYESPYFRSLESGEANLSITTAVNANKPVVYVAWDNRPRKQLLLAKSMDDGENWEQPKQVAGPERSNGTNGPFNIRLSAKEDSVMLIWQSGQPDISCKQFYGFSIDAANTWNGPNLMMESLTGCAQANEFVKVPASSSGDLLFLLTHVRDQTYLSAWNGVQWSKPQLQPILSGFEDPEIFSQVLYSCHQATVSGERLYIVGCDQGGGGDIWITSRNLETASSWFSTEVWTQFVPITNDQLEISDVKLLTTGDGLIHALFNQQSDPSIYYTRWDGTTWSRISRVMRLPDGEAEVPTITAGPDNELFLVAGSNSGSLYFNRAKSTEAVTPSGWSAPVRLQIAHDGKISSPDIAWDGAGTIYIAYSVPVNDERGIYLIQSNDLGKTWSEPHQVFDGAGAGFELVGSPTLHVSADRKIFILWKQQTIRVEGVPESLALYFAHSEDAGLSFSDAERLVEAPVNWQEMAVDSKGNLHVFWHRLDDIESLWDQISLDNGRSWESPMQFPAGKGVPAVAVDTIGQLHLLEGGLGILRHWLWDGTRWHAESSVYWTSTSQEDDSVEMLASSVNLKGKMVVVMVTSAGAGENKKQQFYAATSTTDQQPTEVTAQETPDSLLTVPMVTSTALVPTPEPMSENVQPQTVQTESSNPGFVISWIYFPVALLIFGFLGIVSIKVARGRAR
jgi:hypothetical protein